MFDRSGHILILTGSPGAGKSTAARSLAAASAAPAVHLHADDFWLFIRKGAIPPYLPEAHSQNEIVIGVVAQAAEGYARGGYFVVVDGIVGPWFLHPFTALKQPLHYVILMPALETAIERCRLRGGDTLTDPEPVRALHQQFSVLEGFDRHVIDTAGHGPDDTLHAVQAALASGRFRVT
jgi:energy-coupling factor transporter ATP-binding protein EcfA2